MVQRTALLQTGPNLLKRRRHAKDLHLKWVHIPWSQTLTRQSSKVSLCNARLLAVRFAWNWYLQITWPSKYLCLDTGLQAWWWMFWLGSAKIGFEGLCCQLASAMFKGKSRILLSEILTSFVSALRDCFYERVSGCLVMRWSFNKVSVPWPVRVSRQYQTSKCPNQQSPLAPT